MKLIALDQDDIEIVSTHVQDAILRIGDIHWLAAEQRLVIALNRFDWEMAQGEAPDYRRCRTALRFDRVRSLKCRGIDPTQKTTILNLLAVEFSMTDAPAGTVILTFSDDAALRLEVECLECQLADLGPAWTTTCCPHHADDEVAAPVSPASATARG